VGAFFDIIGGETGSKFDKEESETKQMLTLSIGHFFVVFEETYLKKYCDDGPFRLV
jgi:hypothetical protein